jgi:hypothetical protein
MSDPNEAPDLSSPADLLAKMTELGMRAQSAVLQAEVDMLAQVMSGLGAAATPHPHPPATDAEVESGFDNMPV